MAGLRVLVSHLLSFALHSANLNMWGKYRLRLRLLGLFGFNGMDVMRLSNLRQKCSYNCKRLSTNIGQRNMCILFGSTWVAVRLFVNSSLPCSPPISPSMLFWHLFWHRLKTTGLRVLANSPNTLSVHVITLRVLLAFTVPASQFVWHSISKHYARRTH